MSSPQSLHVSFGPTLGALLVGVVLGSVFLGITCLQTAFYYRTYSSDSVFLKVLVAVLCVLDVLSLALWSHACYSYLVTHFGDLVVAESLIWSVAAEPLITGLIALSVHLFLSWRIQILDYRWRILSIVIALASFGSFSMVIAGVILEFKGLKRGLSTQTVVEQVEWCTLAGDISASVIVLTISGSISFLLYRGRSGFSNTNRILGKLTLFIVASGAIACFLRVLDLILSRAYPDDMYFLIPYISSSKAYTNALLATLNSRPRRPGTTSNPAEAVQLQNVTWGSVHVQIKAEESDVEA